jgi:hypothetical protein
MLNKSDSGLCLSENHCSTKANRDSLEQQCLEVPRLNDEVGQGKAVDAIASLAPSTTLHISAMPFCCLRNMVIPL